MAFVASQKVEPLDYDLTPDGPKGRIPEPTSDAVETYQRTMVNLLKDSGVDPARIQSGEFKMEEVDGLLQTAKDLEQGIVNATCDLTGLAQSTINALPYRLKLAFLGWIQGEFSPQR